MVEPEPQEAVVTPRSRYRPWLALAAGLLLAGGLAGWRLLLPVMSPTRIPSLAVLPLENVSGDAGQDYFVDGMTDELITELARVGSFHVISRTSVMRYRQSDRDARQISPDIKQISKDLGHACQIETR